MLIITKTYYITNYSFILSDLHVRIFSMQVFCNFNLAKPRTCTYLHTFMYNRKAGLQFTNPSYVTVLIYVLANMYPMIQYHYVQSCA